MERLARGYMAAFRDRDEAWWERFIDDDFVRHDPGIDFEVRGVAGVRRLAGVLHGAFSDVALPIDDIIVEGDRALVRIRMQGVQTGAFAGVPASGSRFDVLAMDILRVVDGRIVEQWAIMDRPGLLAQISSTKVDGD